MKAEILKIAGVKSEKDFYKKFPTEESFIKVHGKALKKAQMGAMIQGNQSPQTNPRPINFQQLYDQNDMYITGSTQDMRNKQAQDQASLAAQQQAANKKSGIADAIGQIGKIAGDMSKSDSGKNGKKLKKAQSGIGDLVGKAGGPMAVAQAAGDVVGGFQQMKDEKQIMKQAQQMAGVSDVALQASQTQPEQMQRKYVRPDSPGNISQPGELYNPLGYGTNILAAKNGTEIANTFAPNTIYKDLGYAAVGGNFSNFGNQDFMKNATGKNATPGQTSDIFKFAEQGGGDVLSQFTNRIGNPKGQGPSGGGKIGGGIGTLAGTALGGPVGGMVLGKVGEIAGNLLDKKAEKTEAANKKTQGNIEQMALGQGTRALQQANASYMRDGGMANPQIINQFGNYKLSQLLQPDPTMDTLRAGGEIITAQKGLSSIYKNQESGYISGGDTPEDKARQAAQMKNYGASFVPKEQVDSFMGNWNKHRGSVKDVYNTFSGTTPDQLKNMSMEDIWKARFDAKKLNSETYNKIRDEKQLANSQIMTDQIRGMRSNYLPEEDSIYDFYEAQGDSLESSYNKFNKLSNEYMLQKEKESGLSQLELDAKYKKLFKLRAGGHLNSYTPPSERAMYTGREQFAMGGDLETHWGGYAEPMSYNPYLPEGGETVMFRGRSHDESDGKGNTGIGITYGDSPVEVERGEPALQLRNGSDGDNSLTVYGNLVIPKMGAEMIGIPKAAGKKFKNYVADLSKTEQKQNKLVEKSVDELDNLDVNNPYDLLKFESYKANMFGANQKLKNIADEKIKLADLQSAINDTAEEYGFEADALAKGKVKQAKKGASIKKAQDGNISSKIYRDALELEPRVRLMLEKQLDTLPDDKLATILAKERKPDFSLPKIPEKIKKAGIKQRPEPTEEEFDWMTIANQILPYVRPTDAEELDPRQLSGEMLALAQNQLEPVQAQTFQPQLSTPYDISLQDIINKNQADYRAAQRMIGYNPAALAALNAQKYQANQQVLGEQFRLNQGMRDKVYGENRNMLNQANLQNLGILDQQYGRQQQALSNTKATTQAALNSISAKYLQNQASNRELQTYENLYNYRFDPRFRAQNMNPLAQFNLEGSGSSGTPFGNMTPEEIELYAKQLKVAQDKQKKLDKGRNGSLVKAIKSM
jgi:hypothetical protein